VKWLAAGLVLVVCVALAAYKMHAVIHTHVFLSLTPSMQPGLYWLDPGERAERGEIAIACVPGPFARWAVAAHVLKPDTRCDGVEPIVKRVVAVAGDHVAFTKRGVFVNGQYQTGSQRMRSFSGQPIPYVLEHDGVQLRPGEALLLGDNRSASFDGRYFGATDRVLGRAELFFRCK